MRVLFLFIGILIADSMTVLGVVPRDAEAVNGFWSLLAVLFVYALILDLWKKV